MSRTSMPKLMKTVETAGQTRKIARSSSAGTDEDPGQEPVRPGGPEPLDDDVEAGVDEPDAADAHDEGHDHDDDLGEESVAAPGAQRARLRAGCR